MHVLVTGGAGYIGTHTVIELIEAGFKPVIVDNLVNSSREAVRRVEEITGKDIPFYVADLRDKKELREIFDKHPIQSVIHFAGLKAVGESVSKPMEYYSNNLESTLRLIECMNEYNVKNLVFSSSATVYGDPEEVPISENAPLSATNPYGRTKLFIEYMLKDLIEADDEWSITLLRYFNPVGAHKSGLIGEDPNDIPNNLMPYVSQVAVGKLEQLSVFGDDYPTEDGTGVRDYIHVVDLAKGHIAALDKTSNKPGLYIYNLGTGKGSSVLDMVRAFEKASGKDVPYKITGRRPGDIAICYADPSKAESELGWKAEYGIEEMCRDTWTWQSNNPKGYTH